MIRPSLVLLTLVVLAGLLVAAKPDACRRPDHPHCVASTSSPSPSPSPLPSPTPDATVTPAPVSIETATPTATPSAGAQPQQDTYDILLVVGAAPNTSELRLKSRLEGQGHTVTVANDDAVSPWSANGRDLVILSKTVLSTQAGATFRDATCGVIFWEDNAQQRSMMATITEPSFGTAWHASGTRVAVNASAPAELRAGLSGSVLLTTTAGEITYAPSGLASGAMRVAEFNTGGSGRWSLYALERGTVLADRSVAAGRRYYFGLYDDTFRNLTADGLALWDAAVVWTATAASVSSPQRPT